MPPDQAACRHQQCGRGKAAPDQHDNRSPAHRDDAHHKSHPERAQYGRRVGHADSGRQAVVAGRIQHEHGQYHRQAGNRPSCHHGPEQAIGPDQGVDTRPACKYHQRQRRCPIGSDVAVMHDFQPTDRRIAPAQAVGAIGQPILVQRPGCKNQHGQRKGRGDSSGHPQPQHHIPCHRGGPAQNRPHQRIRPDRPCRAPCGKRVVHRQGNTRQNAKGGKDIIGAKGLTEPVVHFFRPRGFLAVTICEWR